jgi:hypothetical protein
VVIVLVLAYMWYWCFVLVVAVAVWLDISEFLGLNTTLLMMLITHNAEISTQLARPDKIVYTVPAG